MQSSKKNMHYSIYVVTIVHVYISIDVFKKIPSPVFEDYFCFVAANPIR